MLKNFFKSAAVSVTALFTVLASTVGINSAVTSPVSAASIPTANNISYAAKGFPGLVSPNQALSSTATTYVCGNTSSCYYYVGGRQRGLSATGASAAITQATPVLGANDFHSLTELAVESSDGQQIVEVGWTVARDVNGDTLPHLFVYHWVNGLPTCYNGCGFVPVSTPVPAGGVVTSGTVGKFKIAYKRKKWQIFYNGNLVGYYPGSLWNGTFTNASEVQIFGEVAASPTAYPKTQMGNGILGTISNSAVIKNYTLLGSTIAPTLSVYSILGSSTAYSYGYVTATSLHYGGPGY